MAFGATLTATIASVAKNLARINQDNYGSEYYLREATQDFRIKIRHSKQKPTSVGGRILDRHNFEFTWRIFATPTSKEIVRVGYWVYIIPEDDDITACVGISDNLGVWAATSQIKIDMLGWLS